MHHFVSIHSVVALSYTRDLKNLFRLIDSSGGYADEVSLNDDVRDDALLLRLVHLVPLDLVAK